MGWHKLVVRLREDRVRLDLWLKEIAPSDALQKWFAHDQKKWNEFKQRYFELLSSKKELIELITNKAQKGKCVFFTEQRMSNLIQLLC